MDEPNLQNDQPEADLPAPAPTKPRPSTPPFPSDRDQIALAAMMGICNRSPANTVALAFRGQQAKK
jgi:hypothetical protein